LKTVFEMEEVHQLQVQQVSKLLCSTQFKKIVLKNKTYTLEAIEHQTYPNTGLYTVQVWRDGKEECKSSGTSDCALHMYLSMFFLNNGSMSGELHS
jgi:hypothetical protein